MLDLSFHTGAKKKLPLAGSPACEQKWRVPADIWISGPKQTGCSLVSDTSPNPGIESMHDAEFSHWSKYQWHRCWVHGTVYITNTPHPIRSEEWNQTRIELIHAVHSQLEWNTKAVGLNSHTDSLKGRLHWNISKKWKNHLLILK